MSIRRSSRWIRQSTREASKKSTTGRRRRSEGAGEAQAAAATAAAGERWRFSAGPSSTQPPTFGYDKYDPDGSKWMPIPRSVSKAEGYRGGYRGVRGTTDGRSAGRGGKQSNWPQDPRDPTTGKAADGSDSWEQRSSEDTVPTGAEWGNRRLRWDDDGKARHLRRWDYSKEKGKEKGGGKGLEGRRQLRKISKDEGATARATAS